MGLFVECVHQDGEPVTEVLPVQSVRDTESFHKGRIAQHRQDIMDLLVQLHPNFMRESGERFTVAMLARDGRQWTAQPGLVSRLLALGVAIGAVEIIPEPAGWPDVAGEPLVRISLTT